jgi:hypothetical protein
MFSTKSSTSCRKSWKFWDVFSLSTTSSIGMTKLIRHHNAIPISDYQKQPSFLADIKLFCADHNQRYQQYCVTHEYPICDRCIKAHKGCNLSRCWFILLRRFWTFKICFSTWSLTVVKFSSRSVLSRLMFSTKSSTISDYQKQPSFLADIKLFCADHNQRYQHYCVTHEYPICYRCIKAHRECSDVISIDEVVEFHFVHTQLSILFKWQSKDVVAVSPIQPSFLYNVFSCNVLWYLFSSTICIKQCLLTNIQNYFYKEHHRNIYSEKRRSQQGNQNLFIEWTMKPVLRCIYVTFYWNTVSLLVSIFSCNVLWYLFSSTICIKQCLLTNIQNYFYKEHHRNIYSEKPTKAHRTNLF